MYVRVQYNYLYCKPYDVFTHYSDFSFGEYGYVGGQCEVAYSEILMDRQSFQEYRSCMSVGEPLCSLSNGIYEFKLDHSCVCRLLALVSSIPTKPAAERIQRV